MNQATRAALFSAFFIPGWGQFYLKRYKRGLAFMTPVVIAALAICWMIIQIAKTIISAAPLKEGTVQLSDILRITAETLQVIDFHNILLLLLLIVILWILSIIDAYQLGKKMMMVTTTGANQQSSSPPV